MEEKKNSRRRNITEADRRAAAKLKEIWLREQDRRKNTPQKFTQESAGLDMGWGQSAVSQYLQCHISLGVVATLKFARYLGCKPTDIRSDLAELGIEPGQLSIEAIQLAIHWQENLPPDARQVASNFIFSFPDKERKSA